MTSTLYRNGVVHSAADPFAQALLVVDGVVAWLGADDAVPTLDTADEVVDLDGALLAPAFVDADQQVLELGVALAALDLRSVVGVDEVLEAVRARASAQRAAGDLGPVLAWGWAPGGGQGRAPTAQELDRAGGGAQVHLVGADGSSGVVSGTLAADARLAELPGWHGDGRVSGPAHERARAAVRHLSPGAALARQRAALAHDAAHGIVAVHEHTPSGDGLAALAALLGVSADPTSGLPAVLGHAEAPCESIDDATAVLAAVPGLIGLGLTLDGSVAAREAALTVPYADDATSGDLLAAAEQVANHVSSVTSAGRRAVLRATGDRALAEALLGVRVAAEVGAPGAVRAAGHRVVGGQLVDAASLAALVLHGLSVTLDPTSLAPGAAAELARARLGQHRAGASVPLADLTAAGVPLALGTRAPAGLVDPWAAVRAALEHPDEGQRVSARAAFRAHTRGGWRVAGLDASGAGELRVGAPAHLAAWRSAALAVQGPRRARWSTDARAATPLLPELGDGVPSPQCLLTVRDGVVLHDATR